MKEDEDIPQAAPGLRFARYRAEVEGAIHRCMNAGAFIGGRLIEKFESELAGFLGVRHVVSCNSGTDALYLSLRALGIGTGDEVILPALTAVGTGVAVTRAGAIPRLADVDRTTRNLDANSIRSSMSSRVRAIIVVHLHGIPAELDPIMEFAKKESIYVIEDCAQAIGAKYHGIPVGTFGDAGTFSFYPTKNLGCMGDGGAVATSNTELSNKIRSIGNYGWNRDRACVSEGTNSRLDAIQAAVLSSLLPHLNSGNAERVAAAKGYNAMLSDSKIQPPPAVPGSIYHQYAAETEDREALVKHLARRGIASAYHYKVGLHEEPYFRQFLRDGMDFPNTRYLTERLVSLPIQPELMAGHTRILDALKDYIY